MISHMAMSKAAGDCPAAPILRQNVYTRTLHRACEQLSGVPELAVYLSVAIKELQRWLEGLEAPPQGVFLAAVDIVSQPKRG
jgi:hypothetical protein